MTIAKHPISGPEWRALTPEARYRLCGFAYHEAGHVVVAIANGVRVLAATIEPRGDWAGHVRLDSETPIPKTAHIAVLLAGDFAQARYTGTACSFENTGFGGDRELICQLLQIPKAQRPHADLFAHSEVRAAFDAASATVNAHWGHVETIAGHLLHHGEASGRTLCRLIGARYPEPPPPPRTPPRRPAAGNRFTPSIKGEHRHEPNSPVYARFREPQHYASLRERLDRLGLFV